VAERKVGLDNNCGGFFHARWRFAEFPPHCRGWFVAARKTQVTYITGLVIL
jgi:hypothetical protein